MENDTIIGSGWAFPPKFDRNTKDIALLSGAEDVNNSIYIILHTKLGERIMRDDFGSNIYDLVFEPLTENMKTYVISSLKQALVTNEPRISIENITLIQEEPTLGKIDINITYKLIATNVSTNLVVPFYTPENYRI